MKLYYSGAQQKNTEQRNPELSLGGLISSTAVPNGRLGNLFGSVSINQVQDSIEEIKCVFLKNTLEDINDVLCYYENNDSVKLQIAVTRGDETELLQSSLDSPYSLEFYDFDVKYSQATITLQPYFSIGDEYIIEDVTIISDGTVNSAYNDFKEGFQNHPKYTFIDLTNNTFILKCNRIGNFAGQIPITTPNPDAIVGGMLSTGVDNSQLITDDFKTGDCLGIFIKRQSIVSADKDSVRYQEMLKAFQTNNYQPLPEVGNDVEINFEW